MAEECCSLLQAEQALVLVVDKSEQEFWCRLPSRRSPEESMDNKADTNKRQMGTVRSTLLPLANTTGPPSATVPCGLASLVYHTKRPLLLPAGQMARHAKYSMALDNSDRLVVSLNASTLLVPIIHENRVLAVVQVCGKLTQVEALGLTIALERSAGFTPEDQTLLSLVCHFTSGLIPKVAYFTDVESNKVNEETFIQLAPEIFTCLHFDELGKVVIENAKSILDADRCSLFVADSASRTLHNWHSDISGAGVEVYQRSAKKSEGGMTIHFGQGIVGLVAETQQPINIPDAYDDPRFNSAWDVKTHYRTKSMLTVPIISNVSSSEKSGPSRAGNYKGNDDDEKEQNTATPPKDQVLLGVVQVINKSGGAPFRAKDEFLLQTISKLIALAIENSQLFQRNQELCWNVGKLIADGDIVEAIVTLGTAAEQIIGVEGAAVYVMDPDTQELVTFHHKRRYRISLVEPAYRGSIMDDAVHSQQLTITNDVSKAAQYNAFVDSINGISARNVLFAPLLVEESDSVLPELCKPSGTGASSDNGQRLVGLLQLVNIKGRKDHFDQHDLFLSIVQSQSCSVLAAILEKQRMLRQKEQIALLLDASMSFFKEDLITVSTRARRMQDMLELSRQVPKAAMSLTLTSRGHLGSFSQPINVLSRSFSGQALFGELHPMSVANLTVHSLYMDEEGHRWAFLLSGVTAHEMSSDHYIQWIGKSMELLAGHTEAEVFARLRLDLQNVYARKEVITGVIDTRPSKIEANGGSGPRDESGDTNSPTDTLPRPIVVKIRQTLWGFTDTTWQVDLARASHALFGAFVRTGVEDGCKGKKLLSRRELQQALGTEQGGAGISMGFAEWDQLHGCFADKESGLVDVEAMLAVLRPHLKSFPLITYELAPVLDTVTQVVVSVQVLLHG
ncbi:hypothetical protein PHYBOEH_004976 [Phytophthora boehmeriae]|uniref:GAF domain-containing protein n=1 Tax=Phytophthora boehmeriae TaxID=109152 RepID=A0A8T1WS32_9STRA|nr:hypothetical protein PHYBOEH_004976 [Phytophthora boehmeriae]